MVDSSRGFLAVVSFSLALLTFAVLKKFELSTRSKILLIYLHLSTLFFPFVLFGMNMTCGMLCMSCYEGIVSLVAYSLLTTLGLSLVAGFVVIPTLFVISNRTREITNHALARFVKKHAKRLNIKAPKLYILDKAEPVAFSFRSFKSAIFLSVGVLDILKDKEIKAIILHELAHISYRSSVLKLSNIILRLFSPFSLITRFHDDSGEEEKKADEFVTRTQKTDKHLLSAKKKIDFYRRKNEM
jgi:Zn-dependent protease with chaperone function